MILGTVEIGVDYGINNRSGKPSYKQAYELLDEAWNHGIHELDTASAYGESEEIIGKYQAETGHIFRIDTKIPVSIKPENYRDCLIDSCSKLQTNEINLLYLHSFEQCKDERILESLRKLKEQHHIPQIGVSIYAPEELEYIIEHIPFVDVIQLPINLLDFHRWVDGELLKKAKERGKIIYARSVYLQGLIFKTSSDPFIVSIKAEHYIEEINRIANESGLGVAELAYKYVLQTPEIDEIIIGCQSKEELLKNIAIADSGRTIDINMQKKLFDLTNNISKTIIDPRKWRK